MKHPRKANKYCPKCKKYTEQSVEEVKKHKASEMKAGQRRFRRVTAGIKGFPRPKPDRKKPTRRRTLVYKCPICKKSVQRRAPRAKKWEWVD